MADCVLALGFEKMERGSLKSHVSLRGCMVQLCDQNHHEAERLYGVAL